MFWPFKRKKKQPQCEHEFHHVVDQFISINQGNSVDLEDGCWIICVKCKKEELVFKENWEHIKRRQEVLSRYANKE